MKRALQATVAIIGFLILGVAVVLLWPHSESPPDPALEQTETYSASFSPTNRDTFTVMTYNLGPPANHRSTPLRSRALPLIRKADPDVLALQNIRIDADTSGSSTVDSIAARGGYPNAAQALRPTPWSPILWGSGAARSGHAILSRYPIRRHLRKALASPALSLSGPLFPQNNLVQVSAISVGGWPLVVINAQLHKSNVETREKQAQTVIDLYNQLAHRGFPVLLLGTFNGLMPGASTGTVSSRFADDETMDILMPEGHILPALSSEVAQVTGRAVNTYPATDPSRKIDYVLHHPDRIIPLDTEVRCGPTPRPSDHCALSMSFLLPRPKDQLPETRIPDDQLPSLDSLVATSATD